MRRTAAPSAGAGVALDAAVGAVDARATGSPGSSAGSAAAATAASSAFSAFSAFSAVSVECAAFESTSDRAARRTGRSASADVGERTPRELRDPAGDVEVGVDPHVGTVAGRLELRGDRGVGVALAAGVATLAP